MKMRLSVLAFSVAAAAACASGPTEVLVVVSSDLAVPGALDHVRITAWRDGSVEQLVRDYDLTRPENNLPLSLGLLPGADTGAMLHVVVTGTVKDAPVATTTAMISFEHNQTRTLKIRLPGDGPDGGGDGGRDGGADGSKPPADAGGVKHNGTACASAAECTSGICMDGVCCNVPCAGACQSCALAAAPGTCMPVAAGSADPRGVCIAQNPTTCGVDGFCDGAGACRRHKDGVVCMPESCNGNVYSPPATCDGAGQCRAMPMTCPANNACGPGGCKLVPVLSTSALTNTPLVGPDSQAPLIRDACPPGTIVVGFDFSVELQDIVYVNGVRAHCGVPHVAGDGTSILIGPGETLPWEGPNFSGNAPALCPSNQAVIGLRGRHGIFVDQLAIRCAPLTIGTNKMVAIGAGTTLTPVGGTGGGPDPTIDCPNGMIAAGDVTRAGARLDQFGLACATLIPR